MRVLNLLALNQRFFGIWRVAVYARKVFEGGDQA
jgi:hypothetical protein